MSRSEKALGARVDDETHGRVHDAVIALSGPPARMTKKKLVTNALRAYIALLQRRYNEGKPFKVQRDRRLVPGARSDDTVGKRKATRVASRARAGARAGGDGKGNAPARTRRRRKG